MPAAELSTELPAYQRDGYLHARGLFTAEEVALIRDTFMQMNHHGPVEGLSEINSNYAKDDPLAFYPRMMMPHRHDDKPVGPVARRFLLDHRVHDILASLMGDEPLAAQSMFYFKPPGARGQDLHQDNFYLNVRPGTCLAAWTAIDDIDQENGGMVVVPRTGTLDLRCPSPADAGEFFTSHHVDPPPGLEPVPVNMKAGDVLFFNGSVIHGSYPNRSKDRFRRAFICHYIPTASVEASHWYFPLLGFDGRTVEVSPAKGGGPCGEVQDAVKGLH